MLFELNPISNKRILKIKMNYQITLEIIMKISNLNIKRHF